MEEEEGKYGKRRRRKLKIEKLRWILWEKKKID